MKSKIREFDSNGLELNHRGAVPYKGVFYDKKRGMFGVSCTVRNVNSQFKSPHLKVSYHKDPREAAFYYAEFMKNVEQNVRQLELCKSGHWKPSAPTPLFFWRAHDGVTLHEMSRILAAKANGTWN